MRRSKGAVGQAPYLIFRYTVYHKNRNLSTGKERKMYVCEIETN